MWSEKTLLEKILDIWSQLDSVYERFYVCQDTIRDYFRPDMTWDTDEILQGFFEGSSIYTGDGPWCARVLAVGLQGNIVPANVPWRKYQMKQVKLRGIDELDKWCQEILDYMTDVYNRSNFYDTRPQFFLDGVTIGSPVDFIEEEDVLTRKIVITPMHYRQCRVIYDRNGFSIGVIVKDKTFTSRQIFDDFCKGGTLDERNKLREKKLSIVVNNDLRDGRYFQEHTIVRAVFKFDNPIWNSENGGYKKPTGKYPWLSVYFEEDTDKDKDTPLENKPYYSRPFVVWNYDKKRYSPVSWTPAYGAIFDDRSNNQLWMHLLENVQRKNRPPTYATASWKNIYDPNPEAVMFVSPQDYARPPVRLETSGDIVVGMETSQQLTNRIEKHFHIPLFQLFAQAMRENRGSLPTVQVWQMIGERATLLSPAIETHGRCLIDYDERFMSIAMSWKEGPFETSRMMEIMEIVASKESDIRSFGITPELIGPLLQAQKSSQKLDPYVRGLGALKELAALIPSAIHIIDPYETGDGILSAVNFPESNKRTKEVWQTIVDANNAQAAQKSQIEDAVNISKIAPPGKAIEQNSPAGMLMGVENE